MDWQTIANNCHAIWIICGRHVNSYTNRVYNLHINGATRAHYQSIGVDCVRVRISNFYYPNGLLWIQAISQALIGPII